MVSHPTRRTWSDTPEKTQPNFTRQMYGADIFNPNSEKTQPNPNQRESYKPDLNLTWPDLVSDRARVEKSDPMISFDQACPDGYSSLRLKK